MEDPNEPRMSLPKYWRQVSAPKPATRKTPKALKLYGINENEYSNDKEMFDLIHEMRTRIVTSKAFTKERILNRTFQLHLNKHLHLHHII